MAERARKGERIIIFCLSPKSCQAIAALLMGTLPGLLGAQPQVLGLL